MNSYPVELLVQHAPLMFVAGLGLAGDAVSSSGSPAPVDPHQQQHERRGSVNQDGTARDPFVVLTSRLRNSFASRRRGAVWDLNKSRHFNVLLVDKMVKFPPRKLVPSSVHGVPESNATPRSPLSPLNPSSPLYPDGLIAPIWVRKHIELVPCVFVLFIRLWESPPPASPLEGVDRGEKEEEKRHDADLAAEIGARRKVCGDRGIKLTVVLMASRRMLDDPNLDTRLSFIRRQSGLDGRAALFILSPLSAAELNEFIDSLQEALLESATDYYSSHTKRIRRKKSRYPQHVAPLPPGSGPSTGRPLRPEGWIVRYEYKMATFAEFRLEPELARKHYEDCWEALLEMFASPALMPPRTKRWAEARVLADSVSFKICKLFLYQSEFSRTIAHFNRHMRRLTEHFYTWGIGRESFEYWSWAGRQYRLFAELLESATRGGVVLPSAAPLPPNRPPVVAASHGMAPSISGDLNVPFGVNPSHSLQHAGYYCFAAASCTQQRHRRYLEAAAHEDPSTSSSPALANERKMDHQAIILELYSKAYEIFKGQGASSDRTTFHVAYRIAETYYHSAKYDLGAKFFERIARTYRRERWGAMLYPILTMWCECARQSGDVEATVPLLLELIGLQSTPAEERLGFGEELTAILESTSPSKPIVLESSLVSQLFSVSVAFWQPSVFLGESAAYQLALTSKSDSLSELSFTAMHLYWDEQESPIVITHTEGDIPDAREMIHLPSVTASGRDGDEGSTSQTAVETNARLKWTAGQPKRFTGMIAANAPTELQFSHIVLYIKQREWDIQIPISLSSESLDPAAVSWFAPQPSSSSEGSNPGVDFSLTRESPHLCSVVCRPHALSATFQHAEPAFLEERYPIDVLITNLDDEDLEFDVDVLMQPSEDEAVNEMTFGDITSSSLLKGISFGLLKPGASARQTLFLLCSGASGPRVLDFSVQSQSPSSSTATSTSESAQNINDTPYTLTVVAMPSISLSTESVYSRRAERASGVMDLTRFDPTYFQRSYVSTVTADIVGRGPWEIEIASIRLLPKVVEGVRLTGSSLSSAEDDYPLILAPEDPFSVTFNVDIGDELGPGEDGFEFPGIVEVSWKRVSSNDNVPLSKSLLSLPPLHPPQESLVALLDCQPSAKLHEALPLTLTVQNRHTSRSADVYLDVDSSEAFVLAGPRHAHMPALLPGTSEQVTYKLMPLLSGTVKLPVFRLYDRRKPLGLGGSAITPAFLEGGNTGGNGHAPGEPAGDEQGTPIPVYMAGQDAEATHVLGTSAMRSDPGTLHTISVSPY